MKKAASFAAVILVSMATRVADYAHAAPIPLFTNPLALNGGLYSEPAQLIANSFSIPGGGSINEVSWYGNAYNNAPFGPLSVTFYQDSSGKPGTILTTNPVTPTIVDTGLKNIFFGGQNVRDTYQFTAAIPTFSAAPGASYFFSVESTGETSFAGNFVWVYSSASPVAVGSFNGGASWVNAPSAVTFTLFSTPILPVGITAGGGFTFDVPVVGEIPIFIDPSVAIGYDYAVGLGDPLFAGVTLPVGIGDGMYTLSFDGLTFDLAGGVSFDFTKYFSAGISEFEVTGIDPGAGLDPTNTSAFPTELTFVRSGVFTGTMTPITTSVPEPATIALLGIGLAGLGVARRRKLS